MRPRWRNWVYAAVLKIAACMQGLRVRFPPGAPEEGVMPNGMTPKRIKELRKCMGLTQVEFAERLIVSFATLNRWERGHNRPLPDRMAKLKEMWAQILRMMV